MQRLHLSGYLRLTCCSIGIGLGASNEKRTYRFKMKANRAGLASVILVPSRLPAPHRSSER